MAHPPHRGLTMILTLFGYHSPRNFYKLIPLEVFFCNFFCNFYGNSLRPPIFSVTLMRSSGSRVDWKIFFVFFYEIISSQDVFFLYCKNFGVDGTLSRPPQVTFKSLLVTFWVSGPLAGMAHHNHRVSASTDLEKVFCFAWKVVSYDREETRARDHFGTGKRGHYERGLYAGEISRISRISKFSRISRKWSDSPLFSTVRRFSKISRISKFSRISKKWTFLKRPLFQKTPFSEPDH